MNNTIKELQKEDDKSIFDKLFNREICFAVMVSRSYFKLKSTELSSVDYTIIVKKEKNFNALKKLGFKKDNYKAYNDIIDYDLSECEIKEFKTIQDKFIKVKHDANGRVYELKKMPFKAKYKK